VPWNERLVNHEFVALAVFQSLAVARDKVGLFIIENNTVTGELESSQALPVYH